jgi:hypothetical protein
VHHLGTLTSAEKLLAAQTTGDSVSVFRLEAPGNTPLDWCLLCEVGRSSWAGLERERKSPAETGSNPSRWHTERRSSCTVLTLSCDLESHQPLTPAGFIVERTGVGGVGLSSRRPCPGFAWHPQQSTPKRNPTPTRTLSPPPPGTWNSPTWDRLGAPGPRREEKRAPPLTDERRGCGHQQQGTQREREQDPERLSPYVKKRLSSIRGDNTTAFPRP